MSIKRYAPEIAFPFIKYLPGEGAHPAKAPAGTIQDTLYEKIHFDRGFYFAIDLFNAGFYWEVHEFLERYWHRETNPEVRLVLQILIQLSALAIKKIKNQTGGVPGLLTAVESKLNQLVERSITDYRGLNVLGIQSWIERWQQIQINQLVLELGIQSHI
jgi:hypothetical protein